MKKSYGINGTIQAVHVNQDSAGKDFSVVVLGRDDEKPTIALLAFGKTHMALQALGVAVGERLRGFGPFEGRFPVPTADGSTLSLPAQRASWVGRPDARYDVAAFEKAALADAQAMLQAIDGTRFGGAAPRHKISADRLSAARTLVEDIAKLTAPTDRVVKLKAALEAMLSAAKAKDDGAVVGAKALEPLRETVA